VFESSALRSLLSMYRNKDREGCERKIGGIVEGKGEGTLDRLCPPQILHGLQ